MSLDRVEEVVVPEEALSEERDPRELPMYVSMFVRHALQTAMYLREELPREAVIAATLGKYLAEVDDGGHAQFVANVGWYAEYRADIREGLAILGLNDAARIFADLEIFAELEPERFATNGEAAHEIDPYFHELDRRFYGPVRDAIDAALPAWIRTRPWLRTMPEAEYVRRQLPNHRLREERLERRRGGDKNVRRKLMYLQAAVNASRATGWKRLLWRIRKAWYRED